ncbi:TPM domain-containing protein [Fodinibius halophilus]|uniref:TPM domain-containing protein n=1 Tax=Fodinibius halophilus TaxID=1736908 RepID=A0A6M1TD90_9BACT|nr:TPM domain-containing protein [Fodinibius halophilus]NGP89991.1 TPM domain-containing protein [Fodinibius halophilus]
MADNELLTEEQEQQVIAAIQEAENKTSGEIRVHIEDECSNDALERSAQVFHDLGMDQTQRQNGVLIYIASEDHKAAVYAGKGIHTEVEEGFWSDVLDILLQHFKEDAYEEGIEKAVHKVGNKLIELFPYKKGDIDELSNEISYHDTENS